MGARGGRPRRSATPAASAGTPPRRSRRSARRRRSCADASTRWSPRVVARRPAGRPRAVHEQRRLRRHPRQAARRALGRRAAHARRDRRRAPTHLLYLHGFRSSPQSAKARWMAAWVARAPARPRVGLPAAAALAAPRRWPTSARDRAAGRPRRTAVIGSSLGGFYATVVAERTGCRAVLLNPAVDPARDLAAHIGRADDVPRAGETLRLPRRVRRRAARDGAARAADAARSATSRSSPRATRCCRGAR